MIYLDTSYLVRLYFEEPGFAVVRELAATDYAACAAHGRAEILAAFHRKFREGVIASRAYQARLVQLAADDKAGAFRWLPAGTEVMERIAGVYAILPRTVYLRGADALHLGTAAVHGFKTVYSHDSHLLAAAGHFKLKGIDLIAGE